MIQYVALRLCTSLWLSEKTHVISLFYSWSLIIYSLFFYFNFLCAPHLEMLTGKPCTWTNVLCGLFIVFLNHQNQWEYVGGLHGLTQRKKSNGTSWTCITFITLLFPKFSVQWKIQCFRVSMNSGEMIDLVQGSANY